MSNRAKGAEDLPYPVLEERMLNFVPRRLLRGARRDLSDLPPLRPGSVLVFHHGSRYVAFTETTHLTGAEEPVVDATAVALVDTRTRLFTVYFSLHSASAADDFTVWAKFRARVNDPERAAEEGPLAMAPYFTSYLRKDSPLFKLGAGHTIEDIATVRDLVISRIEAYCEFNPIALPGLAVELDSAGVLTPAGLREHEQILRDERWQQEIDGLRAVGEDASIQRHKDWVDDGPNSLTAVGLARGQMSVGEAVENARNDEHRAQAQMAEAFRILQENGAMDYLDLDPTDMVAAYMEKLTGQPVQRSQRGGLHAADSRNREALSAGSDDEDDEQPDEAQLDE
jgi:hypothetical protein